MQVHSIFQPAHKFTDNRIIGGTLSTDMLTHWLSITILVTNSHMNMKPCSQIAHLSQLHALMWMCVQGVLEI